MFVRILGDETEKGNKSIPNDKPNILSKVKYIKKSVKQDFFNLLIKKVKHSLVTNNQKSVNRKLCMSRDGGLIQPRN